MCPPAGTKYEGSRGDSAQALRVRLLGGFTVSVGSRTIQQDKWRLRKAAALVKLLALASGHRLHREHVMDLLWPEASTRAASNNLRQVLYGARRILGSASGSRKHFLSLKDEQLILNPGGQLWVDVDAFEEAAAIARSSRDPATYGAAMDLYAGDLLPGDRYEVWAEDRREELRQLYLALLSGLAGLYEEREEHALAMEVLRKATAREPTLEEAHAGLMRLHALSGRPEQALAQYERLRDTLSRSLGTWPAETTRRLRGEIAAGRLPPRHPQQRDASTGLGKHNLPAPRTSFIGREQEMVEVKRALAMTRLLTLTGAGGSGKTRLAIEVARDLIGSYPDGVWLVELEPLSESDLVAQEVANALRIQERPGEPLSGTLAEALAGKEMLLILDNCEHLIDAAAQLVDTLLASCPRLKVLATSREFLDISGEVNWVVPPLSLPDMTNGGFDRESAFESLTGYEAVRLFVDRTRQRLPDFELTRENAGAVARVCHKLEGIPLAIELATARMGALAVEQVAQRLDASLDVLKGTTRSAAPRQQTLRATLDWSHDLLSEEERTFFRRLSVFAGGWTLEAAEAVCSGGSIREEDVLDLLGGLVDKSLVVAIAAAGSAVRYRMLEPIRQYALEKLEESGEVHAVQDRHATFFLALAEEAERELAGPQQGVWAERLEPEHDNMREALSWVLERGQAERGLRFCGGFWRFWHNRSYWSEGVRWLDQTLAAGESVATPARVKALEGMGWLVQAQGDVERARETYKELLDMSRELSDKGNIATALNSLATLATVEGDNEQATALLEENLSVLRELEEDGNSDATLKRYHVLSLQGYLALLQDDYARGMTLFEESLVLARQIGDAYRVAMSITNLGYSAVLQGDYRRAVMLCEEALAVAHEHGSEGTGSIAEALVNMGLATLNLGEYERATASFKEALVANKRAERRQGFINTLEGMSDLAVALGQVTRAARLWGAAEVAREVTGIALPPGDKALHDPYLTSARSRLGEAAWDKALAEGRSMSLEEAVEYALSEEDIDSPTPQAVEEPLAEESPVYLTPREKEVATLVAQGLTNRQIATILTLSEHTVYTHVRNILKKLRLYSRKQISTWITEHQPLP